MAPKIAGYEWIGTVYNFYTFQLVEKHGHQEFETFKEGDLIARDRRGEVVAPYDGAIHFNCLPERAFRLGDDKPHQLAWLYRKVPDS